MSYVDEVIEQVVAQNPAEPEFHQAVKEVLESLRAVVEANEEAFRILYGHYIFSYAFAVFVQSYLVHCLVIIFSHSMCSFLCLSA